jgi:hypothetical protein
VYVYGRDTTGFTAPTVLRDAGLATFNSFGIDMAFDNECNRLAVSANGLSSTGEVTVFNVSPNGAATFVEKIQTNDGNTFDYAGRGLVWGTDFVG